MKKEKYIRPEIRVFTIDMESAILSASNTEPTGVKLGTDDGEDNVINEGPIFAPERSMPWSDNDED